MFYYQFCPEVTVQHFWSFAISSNMSSHLNKNAQLFPRVNATILTKDKHCPQYPICNSSQISIVRFLALSRLQKLMHFNRRGKKREVSQNTLQQPEKECPLACLLMRSGKLNNILGKSKNIVICCKFFKNRAFIDKRHAKIFLQEKIAEFSLNSPLQTVSLYTTVYGSLKARNQFLPYAHAPGRHCQKEED